jgi:hypothetical protein
MSGGHSNLLATAKSRAIQQNIFNHLEGARGKNQTNTFSEMVCGILRAKPLVYL